MVPLTRRDLLRSGLAAGIGLSVAPSPLGAEISLLSRGVPPGGAGEEGRGGEGLEAAVKAARWIHAEHRIRPEYTYAQTGYMQGAAGIGTLLLHMAAKVGGKPWTLRLPDAPF